jgi:hypothetical protein
MSSFTAITVVVRSDSEDSVRDALRHHEDVFYVESADSLPEAFDASEYEDEDDTADSDALYDEDLCDRHGVRECSSCALVDMIDRQDVAPPASFYI